MGVGLNPFGGCGIQLPCVGIHDKLAKVPECPVTGARRWRDRQFDVT